MSELVRKSVAQEQQERKIETRTAVERIAGFTIVATAVAVLVVLVATAVYDQKPLRLRKRVPYGREGEGLHLPPVPDALNRACPRH